MSNVTCRLFLINNNDKTSRCYSQNFKFTCCASQMRYSLATVFISIDITIVLAQMIRQAVLKIVEKSCSMMPKWHHAVSGSVHHKVSENTKNFVCTLLPGITPRLSDYSVNN